MLRQKHRVLVVGAGVGGLTTACELAAAGFEVTVLERGTAPGGKLREIEIGGTRLDAGPTVLTMKWVFEELFADLGATFSDHVRLQPSSILARHAWSANERLDLYADVERSVDAIASFAGRAEGERYRAFCARARGVYASLEWSFLRAPRPDGPVALARRFGVRRMHELMRISPFETLWSALTQHFHDPRLRQLFGRYATYCGSSPFTAPATLMLVAHVEREGVWTVDGGMHRIAKALAGLALRGGATLRYGAEVTAIQRGHKRATGVTLASGERLEAEAIVVNADVAALAGGHLGAEVARAVPAVATTARSLSAMTWALRARTSGFPLLRHNVFFSHDYAAEFDDIFLRRRLPRAPTVYVCAQDRAGDDASAPPSEERLFCIVNAPALGDAQILESTEIESCERQTFELLERCGLAVERHPEMSVVTTPAQFNQLFPATGGALYGQISSGWKASFARPGSRSRIPGLYLAGGSVHPGPGLPMAALSGRLAAATVIADYASTRS